MICIYPTNKQLSNKDTADVAHYEILNFFVFPILFLFLFFSELMQGKIFFLIQSGIGFFQKDSSFSAAAAVDVFSRSLKFIDKYFIKCYINHKKFVTVPWFSANNWTILTAHCSVFILLSHILT